jgi:hypothetical protein
MAEARSVQLQVFDQRRSPAEVVPVAEADLQQMHTIAQLRSLANHHLSNGAVGAQ